MIHLKQLLDGIRLSRPEAGKPPAEGAPQASSPAMGRDQRLSLQARPSTELSHALQGVNARLRGLSLELGALNRQAAQVKDATEGQKIQLRLTQVQEDLGALSRVREQLVKLSMRKDLTPVQTARAAQVAAQASMAPEASALPRLEMALRVIGAGDRADLRLVNATTMLDNRMQALRQQARQLVGAAQTTNDAFELQKIQVRLAGIDMHLEELGKLRDLVGDAAVSGRLDERASVEVATVAAQAAGTQDVSELPKLALKARVAVAGEPTNWQLVNATALLDNSLGRLRDQARSLAHQAGGTNDALTLQKIQIQLQDLDRRMEQLGRVREIVENQAFRPNLPAKVSARIAELAYQAAHSNDIVEQMRVAMALQQVVAQAR